MRSFWTFVTVALAVVGLFVPGAWWFAVLTALFAIGSAPSGLRADGKRRTGGLLGGAWDAMVVSATMKDCPACLSKIPAAARKCRYCGEAQPTP